MRPFGGDDVVEVLAHILDREPDWSAIPARTTSGIRKVLGRCLQKDRGRRLADISDARFEIEEAQAAVSAENQASK
jgi:hypothetical protein